MSNPWVSHVKQYAAANKMTYGCAMSDSSCKAAYKKEPTKKEEPKPEPKAYTKYKAPIGPVKPVTPPVAPAPKKALDKSTIKKMLEKSMNEFQNYKEPKIKIPKSKK
jgi:hypothetical protein